MRIMDAAWSGPFTTERPTAFLADRASQTKFFIKSFFLYTVDHHEYQIDFYLAAVGITGL